MTKYIKLCLVLMLFMRSLSGMSLEDIEIDATYQQENAQRRNYEDVERNTAQNERGLLYRWVINNSRSSEDRKHNKWFHKATTVGPTIQANYAKDPKTSNKKKSKKAKIEEYDNQIKSRLYEAEQNNNVVELIKAITEALVQQQQESTENISSKTDCGIITTGIVTAIAAGIIIGVQFAVANIWK